jgi:hypothetical protein
MSKLLKLHILTIGRDLYYVTEDYEDAEYEKQTAEESNFQGRKLNIKLTSVDIDSSEPSNKVQLSNGMSYTVEQIMNLL